MSKLNHLWEKVFEMYRANVKKMMNGWMCTLAEISQHQKIRINLNDWEGGRREAGTKDETVN